MEKEYLERVLGRRVSVEFRKALEDTGIPVDMYIQKNLRTLPPQKKKKPATRRL